MAPLWVAFQANLGTLLRTCDAVGACIAVPDTPHYREALAKGDTLGRGRQPSITGCAPTRSAGSTSSASTVGGSSPSSWPRARSRCRAPATMHMIGKRNWWLPRGLDRMLPRLAVEGVEK